VIKRKPYAQKVAGLSFGRRTFLPAPPIFSYTVSHRGFRQRSEMDTVRLFAMLCLAVALAGGLAGAALEVRQLVLAASVVMMVCAVTIVIVIVIETWEGR
jgi:hypothetical protein